MKYDELDLMELFLSESESLTDNIGDGNITYKISKDDFTLKIFIRTYKNQISVFLTYKEKDIFYGDFDNITELKKEDMYLRVLRENSTIASLCFGTMLSISIENQ
ncbi:hypothetical protein QJV15_08505 [Listeria cossartiae subsp. cayugensis]|uniref:hypothetical protein n=1 Tax=Listeria cossartiae TaxID=2838249 RepID=UPI0028808CD8|nr:hypothetical protein [Listeria cossartiae]MDT0000904.1 hypothetical protein [Listeria cossartiae subsp. cayugensis]MDT0008992.1 hypothetical protein [Listeria cossartiae subsp. cayugensis]MDT0030824.1 hypothetical protein [Listeria cossartiae subsp. cayugensis]MDT0038939.1 hypothetical protein [Listeria cossartiae subsp. cayugensis]MDT0044401.1 hypothetical protein [Listeria cossartiae subsp. cayugensis]